jgi:basic amino acid/polyamine antiporter, APA family
MKKNYQFSSALSILEAIMIVAGSMIGSGIFIVSLDNTRNVRSSCKLDYIVDP